MSFSWRRRLLGLAMIAALMTIAGSAAAVTLSAGKWGPMKPMTPAASQPVSQPAAVPLAEVARIPARPVPLAVASQVPVLVYHEMDNGCAATAPTCAQGRDYESVSLAQFRAEMAWMAGQGYHTVTIAQYLAWLGNRRALLPPKPFLITVDNGIADFLEGAEPVLWHFRYTAAAFIVTGFASGAGGSCGPRAMVAGRSWDTQPGCPKANEYGWDATWAQLKALSPAVYSFGIEAGASAHFEQDYDRDCFAFNACMIPGETVTAYENRVRDEYATGISEAERQLGSRFSPRAWVVPYSDLGYACQPYSCAYENHNGPRGWLITYAARHFAAAFVQDYYRNGIRRERFRYEVHNVTTLRDFRQALTAFLGLRAWAWR